MKKVFIPAILLIILALIVAIGSQSFLGACVHEDGSFGACHWASRALLGEGALIAALSLLALVLERERAGLYLASALIAALGLLTPGTLIDLCRMDTMRCRMVMKPAMLILCALMLIVAIVGWLMARGRAKG